MTCTVMWLENSLLCYGTHPIWHLLMQYASSLES